MKSRLGWGAPGLLLLCSCTVQAWRPVELQLDITGAQLSDTDRVRICIQDVGMRESALGSGEIAFTGLPSGTSIEITVDSLSEASSDTGSNTDTAGTGEDQEDLRSGRAGPVEVSPETPWAETTWQACDGACEVCQSPGSLEGTRDATSILAIRFID